MRWYRKLPLRFRSLFLKQQTEQDLNEELAFHMQVQIDDYVAHGMDPETARRAASKSLGKLDRVKEQVREAHRVNFIENLLQDLRFGFRMLRRAPGFSILAVLCLTLGVGANAAVFSWIEGILLRPFPGVAHQERIFALTSTARGVPGNDATSSPDFIDLKNDSKLIEAFIGDKIMGTTVSIGDRAERAAGSMVSANYFDALGIRPILGRGFQPGEDTGRNAHPVTVISYWIWTERLHRDPAVIGKTQILNGVPFTIIGVAPPGFFGTFVGWPIQFFVPASMQETFDSGSGYKLEAR